MKLLLSLLGIFLYLFTSGQNVEPAPPDKAVVYFVRANSTGGLINFTFFDSTVVIGKCNGPKYFRYECEPGHHLFWARSENRDYVAANLEAGKIYVIDVIPMMGAIKAAVRLEPVNSADYKLKRIQKLVSKHPAETFSQAELDAYEVTMSDVIARGMEQIAKEDYAGFQVLGSYCVEPGDFLFVKEKK